MPRKPKEPQTISQSATTEQMVDRLSLMDDDQLTREDLAVIGRIRHARASLLEVENEMDELKERRKARKQTLEDAIRDAVSHYDARQLAFNLQLA